MSGHDPDEPVGYLVLPKGTPVVTRDGVTVGTVHRVQHHERERIFDGIVVQTDQGRRFVDAPEIHFMSRRQVELEIDHATFVALPMAEGAANTLDGEVRKATRRLFRRRSPD
jgi:hypothetical protein